MISVLKQFSLVGRSSLHLKLLNLLCSAQNPDPEVKHVNTLPRKRCVTVAKHHLHKKSDLAYSPIKLIWLVAQL